MPVSGLGMYLLALMGARCKGSAASGSLLLGSSWSTFHQMLPSSIPFNEPDRKPRLVHAPGNISKEAVH